MPMNRFALLAALLTLAALGCGGDSPSTEGGACEQADDCEEGLACIGGICQKQKAGGDAGTLPGADGGRPDAGKHPKDAGADAALDASSDGGVDAALDAATDAASDSGTDADTDSGGDAGLQDGAVDVGDDAGDDAGEDAGTPDAEMDSGTPDTGDDAGTADDTGVDAGEDAGGDAAELDGGTDTGTDAGVADAGTAPSTTISSCPAALSNATSETFAFSSTEIGAVFECSLDGVPWGTCASPLTTDNLADGAHTFSARAVLEGVPDPSPSECAWTTDATAPATSITGGPGAGCGPAASFTFACDEAACSFECSLDSTAWAVCTSPKGYAGLADGTHFFAVRATDAAGNTDATEALAAWLVDTAAPATTINSAPSNPSGFDSADFTFSASEQGATFSCRLDSGAWTSCTSPQHYAALAEGAHGFSVRAADTCGNVDPAPPSVLWLINLGVVSTRIDSGPAPLTNQTSASFAFSCNKSGCTFECQIDGGAWTACTSPKAYAGVSEGAHTFSARATDTLGNTDLNPPKSTWLVDTTPPATTIMSHPDLQTDQTTAIFAFSCSESGTAACKLDGAAPAPCASPVTYNGLADGAHTFTVNCTDAAGNADPVGAQLTWTVDSDDPETQITASPPAYTSQSSPNVVFSSDEPGATFECSLNAGAWTPCASPAAYAGLADGPYTFEVRSTDPAGNVDSTPALASWTVDTVAPVTQVDSGPAAPCNSGNATFAFSANEAGSTFECRMDGVAWAVCASPKVYGGLSDGPHVFSVRAVDRAGNTDASEEQVAWSIDSVAPDTNISGAPSNPSGFDTADFTFGADETGTTFECRLDGGVWGACVSPKHYAGLAEGNHAFDARATDACGNVDTTAASHAWLVNLGPVSTRIDSGPAALTNQTSASFAFSCNKAACTYECRLDGGAWAACTSPKDYAGLAEGTHTFSVRATDGAGNVDASPPESTWTIDTTAPVTTLTSNPANPTNLTTAIFTFTCSEPGTSSCSLDGAPSTACTSPATYAGLAEGAHSFVVACTDAAGNADPLGAQFGWTIDIQAPLTQITSGPPAFTNQTSVSFSFASPDPTATFECSFDGAAWAPCTSPASYSGLADDAYTFTVRAVDAAGNADPNPASASFTVDTVLPDTSITGKPSDPSNQTSPVFTFTSNETGSTFQCRLDAGAWAVCSSPDTLPGLGAGAHTFDVRAVDRAGNTDPTPSSYTWTIDTTPPETSLDSTPSDPSRFSSASFGFSCNEAGTAECAIDAGGWTPCTSPASYVGMSDASHTFSVRCIDTAGSPDPSPASFTWTIDTTPPDSTINSGPASPTQATDATFNFTCSEPGTAACRLDAGAWGACTSPALYSGLSDAAHLFSVACSDQAGNTDPSPAVHTWTVDTTRPETSITGAPPALTSNPSATLTFVSNEGGSTFECQLDLGPFGACASPQAIGPLTDGPHQFCVRATDQAGNSDLTPACTSWTIDTTAPDTLLLTWPADPTNQTTATFTFDATETGCTFVCRLDGGSWGACTSPAIYSGLASTAHSFEVLATDPAGNADLTAATFGWTVDTTPPQSSILSKPNNPTNNQTAVFTFTSNDPGASFECNLDGGGWGLCSSPATYNGLSAGGHTWSVRATDALGNVETAPPSWAWTIDLSAPDTNITGMPANPSNVADPTFTFTATEGGSTFECQLDGGAWTSCASPKQYTGLTDGARAFGVRATDAAGNTDQTPATYFWTIDLQAPDTQLTSTPGTYTNLPDATFVFSSTESPSTFECRFDGGAWAPCTSPKTYPGLADDDYTFEVRATDQAGNTDQTPSSFAWTVDTVAPQTAIDSNPPAYSNQTSATFTFSCSGETQPCTFECSLDAGGYALCASPQQPTGLSNGPHTFRVRAIDAATNVDSTPATYTWTVDTVAPSAFIDSMPANPSLVTDATFTFHCSESGTVDCQLDGGGFASCTSPKVYNNLTATTHTFQVRCTDLAGNPSTPASFTWDITIWTTELADSGRFFTNFYHRSIAADQNNYAHIVYGGANLYHQWYNGSTWSVETLDTGRGVGQYANLVFDTSWNMHVAYWDEANADLVYMTNAGGSWVKTAVDAAINSGQYASLAVDGSGKAHISYYDGNNADLKYATNASGSWAALTVDGAGITAGTYSSIAVDTNGYVHISYYDTTNTDLKYGTNAPAGIWSTTTVDGVPGVPNVGQYSSIALDGSGYAHIAYYDATNGDLKYATNASGIWVAVAADSTASNVGYYTSILVDPSNNVHISYYDGSAGDLKYATWNGISWTKTSVDSTGTVGYYTSIARDAAGKLHVSYYDVSTFKLKYAVKSGSWVAFALDTSVHVGQWGSLAVDSSNAIHASYYDVLNADLKYATKPSGGSWSASAVDTFGGVGQYSHIGVDSNKKPRISYYDGSGGDLKYADNTFGPWAPMTIDNPNTVGQYTGLAVDKNDKVHISYYDATGVNQDLRYASDETGSWVVTVVDSAVNYGQWSSIAVDGNTWSHVSYYDATNGDLRYANNVGGSWNAPVAVDSLNVAGQYTGIAVDGSGRIHISYYYGSGADLKYAYSDDGLAWTTSTIESNNAVGTFTSIAVDGNAKAHVSYYDATNLDLKYATNKYGAWQTFTVDSPGSVGQYADIALDTNGKPHIVYYDASMRALRHATNAQ